MSFTRKTQKQALRDPEEHLTNDRDDCISLYLNSGMTQKQIHENGGPTPSTISKWLYKETRFPRHETIKSFIAAMDCDSIILSNAMIRKLRALPPEERLGLTVAIAGKPKMPAKKTVHRVAVKVTAKTRTKK